MVDRVTFTSDPAGANPPEQQQQTQNAPDLSGLPANQQKAFTDMRAEVTRLQQELAALKKTSPEQPQQQDTQRSDQRPAPIPTQQQQQPDPAQQQQPPKDEKQEQQDQAAKDVANAAGLDLAPYQQEFDTSGDVKEESRAQIAEKLTSVLGPNARQIVDDFIDARKVVVQNDQKMFMEAAGGEESYAAMTQWAAANLPREQVEAYNRQVTSGDRHSTLFAIEGLRAKYEAAVGRDPMLRRGNNVSVPGGTQPFRSSAEMVAAMNDPRYQVDEAYRESVRQRLAVSNF